MPLPNIRQSLCNLVRYKFSRHLNEGRRTILLPYLALHFFFGNHDNLPGQKAFFAFSRNSKLTAKNSGR